MKKLYSPKIRDDFIPALYHHSRDLGCPMTVTVNRYVAQGFASDALSDETKIKLPSGYAEDISALGLDEIVNSAYSEIAPPKNGLRRFDSTDEILAWHGQALNGVRQAFYDSKMNAYEAKSANGRLNGSDWLYRTLALNLNRGLSDALVNYTLRPVKQQNL